MSDNNTTPYTLTATDIDSVVTAFGESDDVIGHRIMTVGHLCSEFAVTPKDVFSQVNAHLELSAGTNNYRPVKGWSASSIANANTAYNLYAYTGVSLNKGTKASRYEFAALVEDVRRAHGAKTVRTVIKDALALIAEETISQDDRRTHFVAILTELKSREAGTETKTTTPEDRLISALRAAVKLAAEVELDDHQGTEVNNLIAELNSFDF